MREQFKTALIIWLAGGIVGGIMLTIVSIGSITFFMLMMQLLAAFLLLTLPLVPVYMFLLRLPRHWLFVVTGSFIVTTILIIVHFFVLDESEDFFYFEAMALISMVLPISIWGRKYYNQVIYGRPNNNAEVEACYELRYEILRKPWNQEKGSEQDDMEKSSIHRMAMTRGGLVVGTGRAQMNSTTEAQVRYMAVKNGWKNNGIGHDILMLLEKEVYKLGATEVVLNAREEAVDFYIKNGYQITSEAATLFGVIKHFKMVKTLDGKAQEAAS